MRFCCRFFCAGGAILPNPNDGVTGYPCPKGFYCPQGTTLPLSCPPGSYSGREGSDVCETCEPGTYCPNYNTSTPEGCLAGKIVAIFYFVLTLIALPRNNIATMHCKDFIYV